MVLKLSPQQDSQAVSCIRGLAMDAPLMAKSGHQGTAMALAPLGHVLYSRILRHNPHNPSWKNRDRFILSNGHASILQYALLFLNGYGLEIEDLKKFRQFGSMTPGHPEVGHTLGVEVTTGPLGQGFANAVGMAIAERNLRSRFGASACDHNTYVIAGDGCFMEGISHEAASLAGHLKLDRLVCIFDDNAITIDGSTSLSCSDDVAKRFAAYGWNIMHLGEIADDLDALEDALITARATRGAPTLCILKTHIGHPSPDFTDAHEAHGNPFAAAHVSTTKKIMGIPDESFWAPKDLVTAIRDHAVVRGDSFTAQYETDINEIEDRYIWDAAWVTPNSSSFSSLLPVFDKSTDLATRQVIQKVFDASLPALPGLIAGSADLTGNTGTKLSKQTAQSVTAPDGRQIYFGIREHAMGAAVVGMALHGGVLPVCGTFFVFADYMRPAIRLAALSKAKCIFVFSHDSVGVGEDGPTHQPVEQLASLRAIPDLQVIRPADPNETVAAWCAAVDHDGPTAIILSRQNVLSVTDGSAVKNGVGIVGTTIAKPNVILLGTGSEVGLCTRAAAELANVGILAQVVSMPSWDRYERSDKSSNKTIFPDGVPVIAVEAGVTMGWHKYADHVIGIDRFGASAPGATALKELGISVEAIVKKVKSI
ncbi:MAG: transketolase [Actinobacteria bacterium]|nr:transketolase [Actinomycetota bacterium]MDA3016613.1 transketolase [Actinomycetota bacterium]